MTADIVLWPDSVLKPAQVQFSPVPYSRSGGVSLGGLQRSLKTDRGYWKGALRGVALSSPEQRRAWNWVRTSVNGMAGLLAVPVLSFDSAPWLAGTVGGRFLTPHDDDTSFSDGSLYGQPGIIVEMAAAAAIGATAVTLRAVYGLEELSGIRFSYDHAFYETGLPTAVDGDEWTVPVVPAIRAAIPQDALLELDRPTCLVHLASDDAMDGAFTRGGADRCDVEVVEATDYWNDLAS
jgi:hypothetical protein